MNSSNPGGQGGGKGMQKKHPKAHAKGHAKGHPKRNTKQPQTLPKVRLMAPFTFICDAPACRKTVFKSTKFNARKQLTTETYLGIKIVKFIVRCPACGQAIEFQTDPQTSDYKLVSGATLAQPRQPEETPQEKLERLEATTKQDALEKLEEQAAANQSEAQQDREVMELYKKASTAAKFLPRSVRKSKQEELSK